MMKLHRQLTLFALLLAALLAHADPGKRINEIKKDPLYIYGEATKPTINEAYDAALNILQFNIQQWYENRDKRNAGKPLRDMTLIADTICARRGGYRRVFAYVAISKMEETLRQDAEQLAAAGKDSRDGNTRHDTPMHDDPQTDRMLRSLMERPVMGDFVAQVLQHQKKGTISAASRDITLQIADSYLAIFKRTKKGDTLVYLLAPGQGNREDLVTGQRINPDLYVQHRDAYRFLWFVPSTSKKNEK